MFATKKTLEKISAMSPAAKEMIKEFPFGTILIKENKSYYLLGYSLPSKIVVSELDPTQDFKAAFAAKQELEAELFRGAGIEKKMMPRHEEIKKESMEYMKDLQILMDDHIMSLSLLRISVYRMQRQLNMVDKLEKIVTDESIYKSEDFCFGMLVAIGMLANGKFLPTYLSEDLTCVFVNILTKIGRHLGGWDDESFSGNIFEGL